ncbi:MAG: hypothetical protein ABI165_21575 [Bryobacteraceae bacterium]
MNRALPNPLAALIADEIARAGPISFARFMELALYHPGWGYYARPHDPFGAAGDFFTAEQLQPVFGILIAGIVTALRDQLGAVNDFRYFSTAAFTSSARCVNVAQP